MKNIVFIGSLISYILFLIYKNFIVFEFCNSSQISICSYSMDSVSSIFNFLGIIALFSVVTYKLPQSIYSAWWSFAVWSIPVISLIILIINMHWHHNPGGWMNMDAGFDRKYIGILYAFFVIGSIVQIARGYRQSRKSK